MTRKPQSCGICQYCGDKTTKSGMTKHLAKCEKRLWLIESAKQPVETIWHLRVQDAYSKEYWLDIEMRGSATLEKLDYYLRAIWLECCGHLSKFTVGGWRGSEVGRGRTANDVFAVETTLRHLYDFGTTSETDIQVVEFRIGSAIAKHPIALMARNIMPEMPCYECDKAASYICLECLYEATKPGTWFLCDEHAEDHPHQEYGEPLPLVNSPRMGMCGYDGPAKPPY